MHAMADRSEFYLRDTYPEDISEIYYLPEALSSSTIAQLRREHIFARTEASLQRNKNRIKEVRVERSFKSENANLQSLCAK